MQYVFPFAKAIDVILRLVSVYLTNKDLLKYLLPLAKAIDICILRLGVIIFIVEANSVRRSVLATSQYPPFGVASSLRRGTPGVSPYFLLRVIGEPYTPFGVASSLRRGTPGVSPYFYSRLSTKRVLKINAPLRSA